MVCPALTFDRRAAREAGFTLLELLVALAVLGVATGVMAALFTASLDLAANNRDVRIATQVAEEYLNAVLRNPGQYRWNPATTQVAGLFPVVPVTLRNGSADVAPPPAMPLEPAAATRTQNEYKKFRWEVYGRLPAENSEHYEVTVVVRWTGGGRPKLVALTSLLARSLAENQG